MQSSGYEQPAPPAMTTISNKSKANPRLIIALVAGALVIILAVLAIVHYYGPSNTVQSYLNNLLVKQDASSTYSNLCSDAQSQTSISQIQASINILKATSIKYDISAVTYHIANENFFGTAQVQLGGFVTITGAGAAQKFPISGGTMTTTVITTRASGLGWCITNGLPLGTMGS
jgi:hypothetical protein